MHYQQRSCVSDEWRTSKALAKLQRQQLSLELNMDRLSKEVGTALGEAADCVRFLRPLRPHVLKITDCLDLLALPEAFGPLMQTLLLIWRHSRCFNSSAKLLSLMRRLVNALITQVHQFLPGKR